MNISNLLASAGRKQDLGMMSDACLLEFRDAGEDRRAQVVYAVWGLARLAALGDDASFERWFETIRDEAYVPSSSSYILNALHPPERADLRARIAERFPSGAEMALGNVRTVRLLQARKADAPDVLERWDELFATDTPWRFEFMPEEPGGWTEEGRKLFARLVRDRPDDLRAFYRGEVQSSRSAVPGLEPSQALAVLDFPKSEVMRTRLVTQIVTQRAGKLTDEERAAAWRVGPDEAQNGLRMATLLAWRADVVLPAPSAAQAAPSN